MQVLSKNDYGLLKSLVSLKQEAMKKTLSTYLKSKYSTIICKKEYLVAIGDIPVALVAHMDTVFKTPPSHIYYDMQQGIVWSPEGLGADDRAGIFSILKIIQSGLRPTIIFTTDEEMGGIGADALVKDYPQAPTELKYIIQLDRRGTNDCVFYDCDNEDFVEYVSNFGFTENFGSFSDISTICPAWGMAGVNLSVGYEDEHSYIETLHIAPMLATIKKVTTMLQQETIPNFKYIPSLDSLKWYRTWNFTNEEDFAFYDSIPCSKCHELFSDYELFPVKTLDGSTVMYCPDCIADENIGWCHICGEAFERYDDNKALCKDCADGGIEWKKSSKKLKKNSKK